MEWATSGRTRCIRAWRPNWRCRPATTRIWRFTRRPPGAVLSRRTLRNASGRFPGNLGATPGAARERGGPFALSAVPPAPLRVPGESFGRPPSGPSPDSGGYGVAEVRPSFSSPATPGGWRGMPAAFRARLERLRPALGPVGAGAVPSPVEGPSPFPRRPELAAFAPFARAGNFRFWTRPGCASNGETVAADTKAARDFQDGGSGHSCGNAPAATPPGLLLAEWRPLLLPSEPGYGRRQPRKRIHRLQIPTRPWLPARGLGFTRRYGLRIQPGSLTRFGEPRHCPFERFRIRDGQLPFVYVVFSSHDHL